MTAGDVTDGEVTAGEVTDGELKMLIHVNKCKRLELGWACGAEVRLDDAALELLPAACTVANTEP